VPAETLTREEVLRIHERLVIDFAETADPISPSGVRSDALLDSAVARQHAGLGTRLKYETPQENAATLLYGLCMDHPFHNGNKRTALVAMLAHLDRNRRTLFHVSQNDLFKLMISVASHEIVPVSAGDRPDADAEVEAIASWIRKHSARVERGEHPITFRHLARILSGFGYRLENPQGNAIDVVKIESETKGLFRITTTQVRKRIGNIAYPGENRTVPLRTIKYVRRLCGLREEDGIDSASFYDDLEIVDAFINEYRTVLRRLARR